MADRVFKEIRVGTAGDLFLDDGKPHRVPAASHSVLFVADDGTEFEVSVDPEHPGALKITKWSRAISVRPVFSNVVLVS
jgi:hypothetical protein